MTAQRKEQEIFNDLAKLCAEPGFAHAIAYFCFRDDIVRYKDTLKPKDLQNLYGMERLIGTEIATIVGLLIKGPLDLTLPPPDSLQSQIQRTQALLLELHQSMTVSWFAGLTPNKIPPSNFDPFGSGDAMREPIFYGGQSAYGFQYRDFAARKYGLDNDWLKTQKDFSIEEARDVIEAICKLQNEKLVEVHKSFSELPPERWTILPGFEFTTKELSSRSGIDERIVQRVTTAFALPEGQNNSAFKGISEFNQAAAFPLISNGAAGFILFQQYALLEALYESPFYWMGADKSYATTALKHRGDFTEQFSAERLESVFGKARVHRNVDIYQSKSNRIGEVDVLVLFGDRAIILQAKSKRLTIEARKGNDLQLREDFKKSVADSYAQGLLCSKALDNPRYTFLVEGERPISIPPKLKEIYVLCVVADHYPALAFQVRQFLSPESNEKIAPPLVMDVFTLDAMTEMLDSPLRLLSYINRRVHYADRIVSSHELTILSDHLKRNLWIEDKNALYVLGDDIASDLDAAMLVRREGMAGNRTPEGILTRLVDTRFGRLIKSIERAEHPASIALGFTLLTISEDSVRDADRGLEAIIAAARKDGRPHDFTMVFSSGSYGITVHCNDLPEEDAKSFLGSHCTRRKYREKAENWFGLCLSAAQNGEVRFGLMLSEKWIHDSAMEAKTRRMPKPGKLDDFLEKPLKAAKLGRNDPCPCGSGLKYKKCHLNKQ
jgi:hypothetical protein